MTATQQRITDLVNSNQIVLFMKGNPDFPMCGFSARVVQILNKYQTPYTAYDVLEDADIRQGVKDYANWPTIPQVYVRGEFIGGCDILVEMDQAGELAPLLQPAG